MPYKKILSAISVIMALSIINGCGQKTTVLTSDPTQLQTATDQTTDKATANGPDTQTATDETQILPVQSTTQITNTSNTDQSKTQPTQSTQNQITTQQTTTALESKSEQKSETKQTAPTSKPMQISSPSFAEGAMIPQEYGCQGSDVNPQINIANVPDKTKSLVLIMDDPDAPAGTWVHWVVMNISPQTTVIAKDSTPSGTTQGLNSWSKSNYGGPCPPSGTHRYYFKLYALDITLSLSSSATKASVENAMSGHILAQTSLMGKYSK